ncbi:hypothetical protein [Halosimplex pelagicum]|jgi:hypothetical protein|uniref:Uncharacterized protein n=1 Tax=Halosimplex pelagicum TaxID=869886 RepID=A0A7D5P6X5_9EURY|nr:hypothetical protein [Halosimplex pelagicum]QLH82357.1 hypothetical protein HZS54_12345 [Halosimplex pelagicum]
MVALGLAAPTTLAFIGGIGLLEIAILVGLLVSCSILFIGINNELSTGRSLLVSLALYVGMAAYAIILLN